MRLELVGWSGRTVQLSDDGTLMGPNSLFISASSVQITLEDSRKLLKWLIEREIRIAKNETPNIST